MNSHRPTVSFLAIRDVTRLAGGRGDPRVAREGATRAFRRERGWVR